MKHPQDFDRSFVYAIRNDVGCVGHNQFAGARNTARASQRWLFGKAIHCGRDGGYDLRGCFGVVARYVFSFRVQIG